VPQLIECCVIQDKNILLLDLSDDLLGVLFLSGYADADAERKTLTFREQNADI
jgi:hypothetical protein